MSIYRLELDRCLRMGMSLRQARIAVLEFAREPLPF